MEFAPTDKQGPQWRSITKQWLVTNRHVVLHKKKDKSEVLPDSFSFHLRKINSGNRLQWAPIQLSQEEVKKRALFHINSTVDVAVIDVSDYLIEIAEDNSQDYIQWNAISNEQSPQHKQIEVQASDDAIVIGYPRGFYDKFNLFPIVKSGIIASRWGAPFNGKPYFLIDAKLFPGSSGSLVISRPININMIDGQVMYSKEKQFVFLGIYSGEPYLRSHPIEFDDFTIIRKQGYDVGVVWYGNLVEDIIKNGIHL